MNILDELDITDSETRDWFGQRFVSICYLALVDETQLNPVPQVFLKKLEWKPVSMLPNLKWDHNEIISKAVIYLKNQVNYLPVGNALLPEKFTIKELQGLYEAILQKKFDRANFQKKILKLNVLKRHEKLMNGGAHKAPYLYSFDKSMYKKLLEEGVSIVA